MKTFFQMHSCQRHTLPLAFTAVLLCGCGGGSDCGFTADKCPPEATISVFTVSGNAAPVNGREQIVADSSPPPFTIRLKTPTSASGDAAIWISDQADLSLTNLEQKVADITCSYYPFCEFSLSLSCSFTPGNLVSCTLESGGGGLVKTSFPIADISPILGGAQTDLFIIATSKGNGTITAQKEVRVTFRTN